MVKLKCSFLNKNSIFNQISKYFIIKIHKHTSFLFYANTNSIFLLISSDMTTYVLVSVTFITNKKIRIS